MYRHSSRHIQYEKSAYHHYSCEFESRSWRDVLNTTLCNKVCQCLVTGRWFSLCTLVSCTNKTDRHDIAQIYLKVVLNTITPIQISIHKSMIYN